MLATGDEGKTIYTLSGEEALTTAEQAEAISHAIGRPISVVQVPLEGLVQGMVAAGVPEPLARVLASFDTNTADGHVSQVTDDFRAITGVAPQRFARWLVANKAALAR